MSLQTYLDQKNGWNAIFGGETIEATTENKDKILEMIECDLSPENLMCDGEISAQAARVKLKQLTQAKEEAENL